MKLDDATIDRLRELGATDNMLTWLREPESVRIALAASEVRERWCWYCDESRHEGHLATCELFAAWHALGHPLAAQAIDAAWDEALRENDGREIDAREADANRARQLKVEAWRSRFGLTPLPKR